MATYSVDAVEIFGRGVLKSEGVVVDKENNVYGGGRNGVMYKVSPAGAVSEVCTLPAGSIPNGVTMDRQGNLVYCDLGKKAMMRVTMGGQVSMIADRVGSLPLTLPNFASYDAEGNLCVSNSSTRDISSVLVEMAKPEPNGALVRIRPDGRGDIVATGSISPTEPRSIPERRRCTYWNRPGTTACALRSKKTGHSASPRSTRRASPPCRTAWRSPRTEPCSSLCRRSFGMGRWSRRIR